MAQHSPILSVFLYGDAAEDTELDVLHCEAISTRSGANDWIIRPHTHPNHTQFLLVLKHGGVLGVESNRFEIEAASLSVVPAGMVHEINFRPDTDGFVITAASAYIAAVAKEDKRLADTVLRPAAYALKADSPETGAITDMFERLMNEFIWNAPARRSAIRAYMLQVLVACLRLRDDTESDLSASRHRNYDLVVRFRELVEANFRKKTNLNFFATSLGVSTTLLNSACHAVASTSAAQILYDRQIIEAKRYLLYTGMTIKEVAVAIGFADPAYFSRFFTRRVGMPPGAFRRNADSRMPRD